MIPSRVIGFAYRRITHSSHIASRYDLRVKRLGEKRIISLKRHSTNDLRLQVIQLRKSPSAPNEVQIRKFESDRWVKSSQFALIVKTQHWAVGL